MKSTIPHMHKRLLCSSLLLLSATALATDVPERFGNDHDDPRTAYPSPVPEGMMACTVDVLQHGFADFEPARARIDAARQCPGPWHKIVLRIDGAVKGRQYDRIGHVAVGGVTVFRTSSPEPSREGIEWRVDKDVTAYAPLFAQPRDVEMFLGNVVDETYTGVFDIKLSLLFFRADGTHPAAVTADEVLPLDDLREDGADTVGRVSIPANSERLLAEVYATGSGGGCEEFWYYATPAEDYWCRNERGPYREVQVLVDGRVAGIAAPYPHIYTGGWSNPFLWYTIPAPRAFDIHPLRFDLTPFIGLLNDGQPHELRLHVAGLAADREGWKLLPNLQVWRDPGVERTRAKLLHSELGELSLDQRLDTVDPRDRSLHFRSARRFAARGWVQGSRGRVETTVERVLDGDVHHRWTEDEDGDDHLLADWRDRETIRRDRVVVTNEQSFGFEGGISSDKAGDAQRLTTRIRIHDDAVQTRNAGGGTATRRSRDRFAGRATWTPGAPRVQRDATAETRQSYRVDDGDGNCWQRVLTTRNGHFIEDETGCAETAPGP